MSLSHKVESSNIDSIDYSEETRIFRVEFKGPQAQQWDYTDVDPEEFEAVLHPGRVHSFSVGKAFNDLIKRRHGPGRMVSYLTRNPSEMSAAAIMAGAQEERRWI